MPSLREFRLQIQHVATDRDEQVHKASVALETVNDVRRRRAELVLSQERLDDIQKGLAKLRKENDKSTATLALPSRVVHLMFAVLL